jgi:Rps23 Pro-64 3,4-dihydroxylase Tpa1-like proline 4-hydroxylase
MYIFTENEKLDFDENRFIVIDNFLDTDLAVICQDEILNVSADKLDRYNNLFEQKNTYRDKYNFPQKTNELFTKMTEDFFITQLNYLSGLDLVNDTERLLWGIHTFNDNDKLDMHIDAGRHLSSGMYKAITLGIYLSKNWTEENCGHLELWDGDNVTMPNPKLYNCKRKILPIFNRCIIFENNNKSWHGAPDYCHCKNDETRIFITLSYLITEPTKTINNVYYKAFFIKRPQDEDDEEKDKQRLLRVNHLTCNSVYNTKK